MDLVPQHIANGTSKFNGQPRLRSLVGRLGVDQAVKPRSEALNSLRARERRLFADRQIGDAESAHPNTYPFGEYVNSSRVKG